jgi:hypothetical protein
VSNKIGRWSDQRDEFVKRASFASLASLAGHNKKSDDVPFLEGLTLIEGNSKKHSPWIIGVAGVFRLPARDG